MKIEFLGLLGLLFIGLKLGNVITWSWWWVLLPIYGPIVLALSICLVIAAICMVTGAKIHIKRRG